ncbi:MAG: oligosaccharide flippase family protein [Sarcina sp.]
MNTKVKNIYYTVGANVLTFFMGIISGFVIPKFLGIEDFGYIKLFAFYVTYVGVSHFGFLDGIYIKYGSYDYKDIPKKVFRGYFRFLVLMQVIEGVLLFLVLNILNIEINRRFIFLMVILNMIICNLTTLFAFIHQFTKRFKVFSINLVLSKLIYVIGSIVLIYCNYLGYTGFIVLQTIINLAILFIYMYINRDLIIGKSESITKNYKKYLSITKNGFFIMIGNFMGVFILGLDRLFIDKFFTLKEFSMYSFAYTLISLFFILLNSITTVIYPYLARMNKENCKKVYEVTRITLTCIMSITLVGYFFIKLIVINILPEYKDSLIILTFLVPTVIYSAQINILISNYYKILKHAKSYTKNNIFALITGILTNIIAIVVFKDMTSIALATLISFIVWVLYSDMYFKKEINSNFKKAMILEILVILIFISTTFIDNIIIASFVYIVTISLIIFKFYRGYLKEAWKQIRN